MTSPSPKLGRSPDTSWENHAHFFGAASLAMRDVLGDIARMLGVSSSTMKRDWLEARLFLWRAMETVDA